ncbi:MAG: hypothetical protein M3Q73_03925 [bacterium]|nr:hypothetical protein [bacterium]
MATTLKKFQSPEEIAQELQNEVNSILIDLSEKDIYNEFRERDMVEIEDGVEHHVHETVIDERINYKLNAHQGIAQRVRIYERNDQTTGKISRIVNFLFKPFQF